MKIPPNKCIFSAINFFFFTADKFFRFDNIFFLIGKNFKTRKKILDLKIILDQEIFFLLNSISSHQSGIIEIPCKIQVKKPYPDQVYVLHHQVDYYEKFGNV